ncbi:Pentatricopeptide repeat [Quillaja saponaria]|uniref:Pentatricopeptide repeat n=1 Tax=Quillaja saponaria TaxID=32244 RepID=A0AAD7PEX5_QUISA|nr:Pentatricopeptide repeat [Quillaja saponaria]
MFMSTLPLLPSPPKPTRNPNRFNSVELQSCLSLLELCKSTTELTQVHSKLIKLGLFHHSLALTRVLASSSLFPNGDMNYTQSIFDRDENPNTFAYNVMIRGYLQHNQSKKAIYMFYKMVCDVNYAPNYITFPFVLKACSKMEAIEEGKQVHGQVIKFGFGDDLYVQNSLISLYSTCGRIDFARMVFEEMKNPDVVSWNSIIKGLVDMGVVQEAREIFDKMPKRSVVTWNCLISGYVKVGFMEEARKLFDEMDVKDSFSWNTMIGGYVDSGITEAALKLFDRMPEGTKDLITFKMMIDGCAKELRFKEVLEIFQEMQKLKVKPDSFILVNALSACSNMVTLEQGEQIQVYIDRHEVEMDAVLGTALVDMFAKCGKIEKAFSVFDGLVERDIVTWNSVIYNLGIHGYSREALAIFSDMLKSNIPPDETTFLGLLTTCCHCGLADDGKRYFHFMSNVYNLAPKVEHLWLYG